MSSKRTEDLNQTLEKERGRVLSVIQRMTRDPVEAEDVLQDVFAEFIETYDLGVAIETIGAWLVRVARNKVLDRFRRRKTQEAHAAAKLLESEEEAIEQSWMREEMGRQILNAIECLPREQREVFVMHELEGKSFQEISEVTGVGVNTLLSRKRAAVLALRDYLQELYDEL